MGIMNCGDFFKKSSSLASVAFMKSPFRHASRLPAVRVGLRRPLVLGWRYAQRSAPSHRLRGVTDTTNGSLRWIAAAHLRASDYKHSRMPGHQSMVMFMLLPIQTVPALDATFRKGS